MTSLMPECASRASASAAPRRASSASGERTRPARRSRLSTSGASGAVLPDAPLVLSLDLRAGRVLSPDAELARLGAAEALARLAHSA